MPGRDHEARATLVFLIIVTTLKTGCPHKMRGKAHLLFVGVRTTEILVLEVKLIKR